MARDQTHEEVARLALIFFENKPCLWEYGYDEEKWPELEAALDSVKDFHIVNALTQRHLTKIANLVDGSVTSGGRGIVYYLAQQVIDSKAVLLLQGLLQMGAKPDLVAAGWNGWTPTHACALGSVDIAQALVLCRPNLALKDNKWGGTPAAWARRRNNLDVANIFEEAERNPFPTIAQLAQQEKWWAVRNLCRRTGIVPEQEKFALHNGKDAIDWAIHHKQLGIAEELEYLLKGVLKNRVLEKKLGALKEELRKSDAEKEAMKKTLNEQREHKEQLQADQAVLKKEVDKLKEMLLLNLTKTSQDHQDLKNELTGLKGKHSKLKDNLQGKLDHQFEQLKQMKADYREIARQKVADNNGQVTHTVQRPVQRVANVSTSKSAEEDKEEMLTPVLEAENKTLKAEKIALEEKVARLQEFLKAQSLLLSSFMKADV